MTPLPQCAFSIEKRYAAMHDLSSQFLLRYSPIREIRDQNPYESEWWWGMDSNHRTRRGQIYSLLRLATSLPHHSGLFISYQLYLHLLSKMGADFKDSAPFVHLLSRNCSNFLFRLRFSGVFSHFYGFWCRFFCFFTGWFRRRW